MTATEGQRRGRPRNPEADHAIRMQTLRLLAEQGYGAMSVEGVAAAAGVSKATIYRRHKDKRDLVVAALSTLIQEAPQPMDTGDVRRDLLTVATDTLLSLQGMNLFSLVAALLLQAQHNPEFLEIFQKHALLPRRLVAKGLLERGVRSGQIRRDADLELALDCVIGSMVTRHLSGLPMDETWIQSVVSIVLDGITTASTET